METLGIRHRPQIKAWMKWYRMRETHRFDQPLGKWYSYGKGVKELSEVLRLENKQLKVQLLVLGKYLELERG